MRITFQEDGGFAFVPAFAEPISIDTDSLPTDEAAELEMLVNSSNVLTSAQAVTEISVVVPPSSRARDQRTYCLVVERGEQHRTVRFGDPVPPALQALVRALRRRLHQQRP